MMQSKSANHHQALRHLLAPDSTQVFHSVVPVLSYFIAVYFAVLCGGGCVLCSRLYGSIDVDIAILSNGCVVNGIILNIDRETGSLYSIMGDLAVGKIC